LTTFSGGGEAIDSSPVDFTKSPTSHIGVFVLFDSAKFGSNVEPENVVKWPELNAALTDCKESDIVTSSCRFYLLFYDDDVKFSVAKFQTDLIVLLNSTLRLATVGGSEKSVEFIVQKLSDRKQDARLLNDVIRDAYLHKVDYFYVIQSNSFVPGALPTSRKRFKELKDTLVHNSEFGNVGVVLQSTNNSIIGLFISKIHVEIFGETFPYAIATLSSALDFITGLYPRNLTHCYLDGQPVPRLVLVNSSFDFNASDKIVQQEQVILERFV